MSTSCFRSGSAAYWQIFHTSSPRPWDLCDAGPGIIKRSRALFKTIQNSQIRLPDIPNHIIWNWWTNTFCFLHIHRISSNLMILTKGYRLKKLIFTLNCILAYIKALTSHNINLEWSHYNILLQNFWDKLIGSIQYKFKEILFKSFFTEFLSDIMDSN